jgi:hypothetical protein
MVILLFKRIEVQFSIKANFLFTPGFCWSKTLPKSLWDVSLILRFHGIQVAGCCLSWLAKPWERDSEIASVRLPSWINQSQLQQKPVNYFCDGKWSEGNGESDECKCFLNVITDKKRKLRHWSWRKGRASTPGMEQNCEGMSYLDQYKRLGPFWNMSGPSSARLSCFAFLSMCTRLSQSHDFLKWKYTTLMNTVK